MHAKIKDEFPVCSSRVCLCVCLYVCNVDTQKAFIGRQKEKNPPPLPLTPYSLQKILYHLCRLQIVKLVTRTLQLLGNHEMHVRNK